MRNLLLSVALIAAPVAVFAAGYTMLVPAAAPASAAAASPSPSLGDMTPYATITTDVQAIAATGDLAAAEARITDLETAWDAAEPTLRPVNKGDWGTVDGAIDDALTSLRAGTPDPAQVDATLTALQIALADPSASAPAATGAPDNVAGIAVTDAAGRALPCEDLLGQLRAALPSARISDADRASATELQTKATERCNADDDARSDAFSAQALALLP